MFSCHMSSQSDVQQRVMGCGVQDTEAFHQSLLHPSAWYQLKDGPSDTAS